MLKVKATHFFNSLAAKVYIYPWASNVITGNISSVYCPSVHDQLTTKICQNFKIDYGTWNNNTMYLSIDLILDVDRVKV